MIKVTIYRDDEDHIKGFFCSGHAEYDDSGMDIVCSSVSTIVIGTINSIEQFTDDRFEIEVKEENGDIKAVYPDILSHDADLLLRSMILTLQYIQESYSDFIEFNIEEV